VSQLTGSVESLVEIGKDGDVDPMTPNIGDLKCCVLQQRGMYRVCAVRVEKFWAETKFVW
jgi:hypothetical protein